MAVGTSGVLSRASPSVSRCDVLKGRRGGRHRRAPTASPFKTGIRELALPQFRAHLGGFRFGLRYGCSNAFHAARSVGYLCDSSLALIIRTDVELRVEPLARPALAFQCDRAEFR